MFRVLGLRVSRASGFRVLGFKVSRASGLGS